MVIQSLCCRSDVSERIHSSCEYDSLESITTGEPIFEEVLYTIPAKGELEMFYKIDRGIYDISKPGHYRIYLDTAEITEYNLDGNYFDFQLD